MSPAATKAAKAMAAQAFQARLREIDMSEHEAKQYRSLLDPVAEQVYRYIYIYSFIYIYTYTYTCVLIYTYVCIYIYIGGAVPFAAGPGS